ncbi:MAG TPA: 2-oxoacid:acceptor oxidoreductase family protein [Natronosporangium sp.]
MYQVRIHGRGGQGVVTTAELLAMAAFADGRHAQAFPSFGAERTGAPVEAYCRIAAHPIRLREPVRNPDAVILQDAALRRHVNILAGLAPGGWLVINSVRCWDALGLSRYGERLCFDRTVIVPATDLAMQHIGRPLPGTALLGAFAGATGQISLEALITAIRRRFGPHLAEPNVAAARAAYQRVTEPAHA